MIHAITDHQMNDNTGPLQAAHPHSVLVFFSIFSWLPSPARPGHRHRTSFSSKPEAATPYQGKGTFLCAPFKISVFSENTENETKSLESHTQLLF